jgi:hypothetical protein
LRPKYGDGFKGAPLVSPRTSPRLENQMRGVNPDEKKATSPRLENQMRGVNPDEKKASNTEEVDRATNL